MADAPGLRALTGENLLSGFDHALIGQLHAIPVHRRICPLTVQR